MRFAFTLMSLVFSLYIVNLFLVLDFDFLVCPDWRHDIEWEQVGLNCVIADGFE